MLEYIFIIQMAQKQDFDFALVEKWKSLCVCVCVLYMIHNTFLVYRGRV